MSKVVTISSLKITLEELFVYFKEPFEIQLSEDSQRAVKISRNYLEAQLNQTDRLIYGVNTGFGSLCNVEISKDQIETLQYNLIVSHAVGLGEYVPREIAKLILLLKIKSLSFGYSGVRIELIEKLIQFYNYDIIPLIYQQGSLGASGDLAPLAHMSLCLLGKGAVLTQEGPVDTAKVFSEKQIEAISLTAKEGLALINGTQFSLAYGVWAMYHTRRIQRWANLIAAMSIEAFECSLAPFDEDLHAIRQHKGQIQVSADIRALLKDSGILANRKTKSVQDPYSFRCIPQVHGASADAIEYVATTVQNEINAVTDNPNIFADCDKVLSGGNFHAQPLALALDMLAIALSELGSISERRVFKLIGGERELPDFLTEGSGLHSGLMIAQYTAASIVSQNKQLSTPASVDSITSSKGQEDHVSMAANAATKIYRVVENLYKLMAIELMTAAQALEYRRPRKSAPSIQGIYDAYRSRVSALQGDRILSDDIHTTIDFIKANDY
ncbi:MAG: histidine ammonia-lyase [Saprospiraceae bacterium]|nr:histidine ammonia-lyase [Saprospiraceae bacterium]